MYHRSISITRGSGGRWEGPESKIRGPAAGQTYFFKRNGFVVVVVFKGYYVLMEPFVFFFKLVRGVAVGSCGWGSGGE